MQLWTLSKCIRQESRSQCKRRKEKFKISMIIKSVIILLTLRETWTNGVLSSNDRQKLISAMCRFSKCRKSRIGRAIMLN